MQSSSRIPSGGTRSESQEVTIIEPANIPDSSAQSANMTSVMTRLIIPNQVTEAEIRWALKLVLGHASFNSCKDLSDLFAVMFNDNEIAKKFCLEADKARYLVSFGLAPY